MVLLVGQGNFLIALILFGFGFIPSCVTMWPRNSISFLSNSDFEGCSLKFAARCFCREGEKIIISSR